MIRKLIGIVLLISLVMCLFGCSFLGKHDGFYCDHCHQVKREEPIKILVEPQMVDMTICHDCYTKYLDGEPLL